MDWYINLGLLLGAGVVVGLLFPRLVTVLLIGSLALIPAYFWYTQASASENSSPGTSGTWGVIYVITAAVFWVMWSLCVVAGSLFRRAVSRR